MEAGIIKIDSDLNKTLQVNGDELDVNNQLKFTEKDKAFHYELEVPGFKRKQIQLVLFGNMLLVEAYKKEKKSTNKQNGEERNEFCFKTILDLPGEIEPGKIKAFYKKHMLLLEVPKLRHSKLKPLRIAIQ
ncbi:MAG: Hsp20/alpha crystallin family protein [Sphingobacteriales bacterium]